MRVGVLGPPKVRDDDGNVLPVAGVRLRALLIRLAIADGRAAPVGDTAAGLTAVELPPYVVPASGLLPGRLVIIPAAPSTISASGIGHHQ